MVPTDEGAAVQFPLAEQYALMGTAAREGAPTVARSKHDDIHAVRGESERTRRLQFADVGDANKGFRLHRVALSSAGRDVRDTS